MVGCLMQHSFGSSRRRRRRFCEWHQSHQRSPEQIFGTQDLARTRFVGLLYMLKMVNSIGDRVGETEYKEIEDNHKVKQGMNKIGKSKHVMICLLMLLSTLGKAVGSSINGEVQLCARACVGALSVFQWLRDHVARATVTFGKEVQASLWPEHLYFQECERN